MAMLLDAPQGMGSGTLIATRGDVGYVLTAKHVATLGVTTADGLEVLAIHAHPDPEVDVAVLLVKLDLLNRPITPLGPVDAVFGDLLRGSGWYFGRFLNAFEGRAGAAGLISVDVVPGASGGPVVDERGRLIGVVKTTMRASLNGPAEFGGGQIGLGVSMFEPISNFRAWVDAILAA